MTSPPFDPIEHALAKRLETLMVAKLDAFAKKPPSDIVGWASRRFYIPSTGTTIVLGPHQIAALRYIFTRRPDGTFPFRTIVWSGTKKSGKSTIGGLVQQWFAETGPRGSEIYSIGNDLDQAKGRAFRETSRSLETNPLYDAHRDRIPGEWSVQKTILRCQLTGSEIKAIAVDAKGEAGAAPALTVWTELWGFEHEDALRFWDEMTPVPTIPDSLRMVETYAGFENESTLLYSLYEAGTKDGRQLTAGELARATDTPLGAFTEAQNDDDPIPIWVNPRAGLVVFWDSGLVARRMPWQQGERGEIYYREQEETLLPNAYRRLHLNEWVAAEAQFIKSEWWDALKSSTLPPLPPGDPTPVILGVDAAVSGDCFAVVMVSRDPEQHDHVAVRALRVWNPDDLGGVISHDAPERFLRLLCGGGHPCLVDPNNLHPLSLKAQDLGPPDNSPEGTPSPHIACFETDVIPSYNVMQIAYDPYQLEGMMQRFREHSIAWCKPFDQGSDRLRSDRLLYDLIIHKRLRHSGEPLLRQHILNAGARLQKDQDSTLRLVKTANSKKIDAAVGLSMASFVCLYLLL